MRQWKAWVVRFSLCLWCLISLAENSSADLIYRLEFVAKGSTTVLQNETVVADIYLYEEVTGGSATVLGDPSKGVTSANLRIERGSSSSFYIEAVSPASPEAPSPDAPSPDFEFSSTSDPLPENYATITQYDSTQILHPYGVKTSDGSNIYQLHLGTIQFTASGPGTATFSFTDFSAAPDIVLANGTALDSVVIGASANNSFTITAQAVPEPSSWVLLGTAVVGTIGWRQRKRLRSTLAPLGR